MRAKYKELLIELTTFKRDDRSMDGICRSLSLPTVHIVNPCAVYEAISILAKKWPGYSGISQYPVPHPSLDPWEAYQTQPLWADDEYGDARREFAQFLL